jgi:hypothetical protein
MSFMHHAAEIGEGLTSRFLQRLSRIVLWLAGLMFLSGCALLNQPATLYISPQGSGSECTRAAPCSMQQAQVLARRMMDEDPQDIQVILRGGIYRLEKPLHFITLDSGRDGFTVTYQASRGEEPVLSGGVPITRWDAGSDGIYRAKVGDLRFRQLYVNGLRAVRARTPNQENETDMGTYLRFQGWDIKNRRLAVKSPDVGEWGEQYLVEKTPENPAESLPGSQVEFIVQSHWHMYILRVESLEQEGEITWLIPHEPERSEPAFGHIAALDPQGDPEEQEAFYWENALEFLDSPGEWFLDEVEGVVCYLPRPGEDLATAEVIVPHLETLLVVEGKPGQPVENLKFKGLTFEHSTWLGPSQAGYAPWQAALRSSAWSSDPFPGMVYISQAKNIHFAGNVLRHSGMHGLVTDGYTQNMVIDHNLFEDISGAGIMLDVAADPNGGSVDDRISHNTIRFAGRAYTDACGIWASFPQGLTLEHNELSYMPYTGISLGWRWDSTPTSARDNLVVHNHIHHVMQKHDDGAGIYTLGRQPGTRLYGNFIHDLAYAPFAGRYPIVGVYLDEGSDEITLGAHVIKSVPRGNEVNLHKTGPTIHYEKPVLVDAETEEGKELIKQAGPD